MNWHYLLSKLKKNDDIWVATDLLYLSLTIEYKNEIRLNTKLNQVLKRYVELKYLYFNST